MTYTIYIDHPNSIDSYKFFPGERCGDDVVSRELGIKSTFVCNSYARISKGDIYEILFNTPEDATAFVLKCEYDLVDKDKIEKLRNSKK
jgi:hypothetical protein